MQLGEWNIFQGAKDGILCYVSDFFQSRFFSNQNLNTFRTNIKNISDFFHNLQVPAEIIIQLCRFHG